MAEGAEPPPLRIGTDERDSAMKALDAHLSAGRLGVQEYADRSAVAANATVASELSELFTDLPEPHPVLAGSGPRPAVSFAKPATAPGEVAQPAPGEVAQRPSGFLDSWGGRVVALAPFAALALFLVFHVWWVWLLIPAVGALVHGGHDRRRDDHDRRRRERRDRRDERRR